MAVERFHAESSKNPELESLPGIQFEAFLPSKVISPLDLRDQYAPPLPDDIAFYKQKYGPTKLFEADPETETFVAEELATKLVERTGVIPDVVIVTASHLPSQVEGDIDPQRRANHVRRHLAAEHPEMDEENPDNTVTVSAACSSTVVALDWLHKIHPVGQSVMLIAEETGYRRTLQPPAFDSGRSRLIFSDAAIAMQFRYGKDLTVFSSTGPQYKEDTEGLLHMRTPDIADDPFIIAYRPPFGEYFAMNGPGLRQFFDPLNSQSTILDLLDPQIDPKEIHIVLAHQASSRMVNRMGKMGFESAREYGKGIFEYGNTSSASILFDLRDGLGNGSIQRGDNVLKVAYGGGLTWGAVAAHIGPIS